MSGNVESVADSAGDRAVPSSDHAANKSGEETSAVCSGRAAADDQTTESAGAGPSAGLAHSQTMLKAAMLDYEMQIFLDMLHEDGLLVMAKGLGLERLLAAFVRVFCDRGQLVLVIGTARSEEDYIIGRLEEEGCSPLPRTVTAETSVTERQQVYLQGGVLFVTSRILVVDLLTERCPADLVTGMMVYRAHAIVESAQEAFILRLYRQKNKTGFIKAFSSSPLSFTAGFCQVQRVMRNLFVRHLYLWPRFHLQVNETLKKCTPDVVEVQVKMTPLMASIQTALLDLINITVKEFRRLNRSLDWEALTVETVISRSFHKMSRLLLDPVWNQLSVHTRQLVSDLRTLRSLLVALPQLDSCSYYQLVVTQQTAERALNSGWAILDSAETVFVDAKERVFLAEPAPKRIRVEGTQPQVLHMEEPPKWRALAEVLREIRAEVQSAKVETPDTDPPATERVLIVAADMAACRRIKEFLTSGAQAALWRRFQQLLAPKFGEDAFLPSAIADASKAASEEKEAQCQSTLAPKPNADREKWEEDGHSDELLVTLPTSPLVLLQPVKEAADPYRLHRSLQLYRPRYIILYDMDMAVVRTVEVHQAATPERRMRVYTLMFGATTEEQAYLSGLRAEKQAFEYLIGEKAAMVVPEEREGRDELNADLQRGVPADEAAAGGSRRGGPPEPAAAEAPRVIVDLREFRSELPALLHRRGVDIVPATIEVGDYIVTPEVCVERKSVSDLIGSLMSGRLYSQAQAMFRHYRRPMLLIEFDQDKPFSLQGKYYLSSDMSSAQVVSRLQLLTLHFPRLRLMWCPSPYASAELLHQLKVGAAEPSLAEARAATADRTDSLAEHRFNPQIQDFISKLPGVRDKNLYVLLNQIDCLMDLVEMKKETLAEILGSESDAADLHEALHASLAVTTTAGGTGTPRRTSGAKTSRARGGRPRFWSGKSKS